MLINIFSLLHLSLREKCLYSEILWSVFSPNAGKDGPEKFRIETIFTQYMFIGFYKTQLIFYFLFIPLQNTISQSYFFNLSPKRKEDLEHIIENNYEMGNIIVLAGMS